jgi:hypothetical protein
VWWLVVAGGWWLVAGGGVWWLVVGCGGWWWGVVWAQRMLVSNSFGYELFSVMLHTLVGLRVSSPVFIFDYELFWDASHVF